MIGRLKPLEQDLLLLYEHAENITLIVYHDRERTWKVTCFGGEHTIWDSPTDTWSFPFLQLITPSTLYWNAKPLHCSIKKIMNRVKIKIWFSVSMGLISKRPQFDMLLMTCQFMVGRHVQVVRTVRHVIRDSYPESVQLSMGYRRQCVGWWFHVNNFFRSLERRLILSWWLFPQSKVWSMLAF